MVFDYTYSYLYAFPMKTNKYSKQYTNFNQVIKKYEALKCNSLTLLVSSYVFYTIPQHTIGFVIPTGNENGRHFNKIKLKI